MFKAGYAQEIITPPVGVGLAGYFNTRPNDGMYDDLLAKALVLESNGKRFGFLALDLIAGAERLHKDIDAGIRKELGDDLADALIVSCTHTHTGPQFKADKPTYCEKDVTEYAYEMTIEACIRAVKRAVMNLLPAELFAGSVFNNPYAFVRRYWMKNGTIVTNPGWGNPDIDRPEDEFDRTINILKVVQNGRIVALMANIGNHGDTIGGNTVSADWYGRFTQEIQYQLHCSLPVLVVDDASGDLNHFDFKQIIKQSSYKEANRIGKGYAAIVLDALDDLEPLKEDDVVVKNGTVVMPHRQITDAELEEAKHTLATVPDIKKDGDLESQDLANKVPAALRFFAQRVIDCREKSVPSHSCRLTSIKLGNQVAFVSLPGEPFNGIARAIRKASPCKYTYIIELAQSVSDYVPMPECFERGGYEVQAGVDTPAPNAATVLIDAALETLK